MDPGELFPYKIVAFLDVLGFASMIDKDTESLSPHYLPRIVAALRALQNLPPRGISLRQFSDSIVLSAPYGLGTAVEFVRSVAALQFNFSKQSIFLRGGVSYGRHYESEQLVFSNGLVKAYRLESERARFPRVLVDKNLVALFEATGGAQDLERLAAYVLVDEDEELFVDYLVGADIKKHEEAIASLREQTVLTAGILDKLRWLAKYHTFASGSNAAEERFGVHGIRRWRT